MKILASLLFLVISVSGCRTYQYVSVKSNQLQQNDKSEFVAENDSVQISYSFKGEDFPLSIRFMNKLNKAMVIDWNRSSLIINGQAYGMLPQEAKTKGQAVTVGSTIPRPAPVSYTDFSAVTTMPPDGETVPPMSFVARESKKLTTRFLELPAGNTITPVATKVEMPKGSTLNVKMFSFEEKNSPMLVRTFLTTLMETDGKIQTVTHEHAFYVSSMFRTNRDPYRTGWKETYTAKASVGGEVLAGVAGAAVVGVLVIAAVNNSEKK
ncbi:hypothetical protein HHL16_19445 [Pseudoflavitalea sp. G-6-1-2]|uniref:hypothetical protein n=1 Tax=Pseudoflavitalea sp. G-6-1-2 TaxID=2728841 RepID=UPI001469DEC4|nr:hypothetical protein [Pseudoflavitalea sp. G-6-1-2]NML23062.1 hypothetical protein [Pseudoflavitalea sp. G-6-1-2]